MLRTEPKINARNMPSDDLMRVPIGSGNDSMLGVGVHSWVECQTLSETCISFFLLQGFKGS